MKQAVIVIFGVFILASCGRSTIPQYYKPALKENVLPLVKEATPKYCAYSGRAALRYKDPLNNHSAFINIKKYCDGNADIAILGPFGIISAYVHIKEGEYQIIRDGEDITHNMDFIIQADVISFIKKYMVTPPVELDDSWSMRYIDDNYIFSKENTEVEVSNDFRVTAIYVPGYAVRYGWKGRSFRTFMVKSKYIETELEFYNKWTAE